MKALIDTNILLEIFLDQEKADQARQLLDRSEEHEFFLSDFSLHSIGLLLFREKKHADFRELINDLLVGAGYSLVSLSTSDMDNVIQSATEFKLDFDDAYQYAIAEKQDLVILSFDADFDRTKRGRNTPAEVLTG